MLCVYCNVNISSLTALCGVLPAIDNGRIEYFPDTTAPFDVSTVAMYMCDEGYVLMGGSPMRNCIIVLSDGGAIFNGTAPTCERKWTTSYNIRHLLYKVSIIYLSSFKFNYLW